MHILAKNKNSWNWGIKCSFKTWMSRRMPEKEEGTDPLYLWFLSVGLAFLFSSASLFDSFSCVVKENKRNGRRADQFLPRLKKRQDIKSTSVGSPVWPAGQDSSYQSFIHCDLHFDLVPVFVSWSLSFPSSFISLNNFSIIFPLISHLVVIVSCHQRLPSHLMLHWLTWRLTDQTNHR